MKHLAIAFLAAAAALAGCTTTTGREKPKAGGYRAGNGPTGNVVRTEAPAARLTASNLARALRVKVAVAGVNGKSAADAKLAETVATIIRRSLGDAGFEVVFDGDAEVAVAGTANCIGASERGSRAACRGSLELSFLHGDKANPVTGKNIRRVVSTRRFDAKGKESRSAEEALVSLGDAFAAPVDKWVREAGAKATADLAICEVTIRSADGRTPIGEGYPTEFVKTVLKVKGVHDCRISPAANGKTAFKATVVYEPRQIPEGVLNRLMSIKSLKIGR